MDFTKYKIIVPTEQDKIKLEEAFEHIHNSDVDFDIMTVNQLAHEYLTSKRTGNEMTRNNIIVNSELYNLLDSSEQIKEKE